MSISFSILLWFSILSFAGIGAAFLLNPLRWAQSIDIRPVSEAGKVDIRATYGGGFLALSLFWFWCSLGPARYEAAVWSMTLVYGGLAMGRILSWLAGDKLGRKMVVFLAVEVVAVVWAVWLASTSAEFGH